MAARVLVPPKGWRKRRKAVVAKSGEPMTEVAATQELNELRAEVARLKAAQPKFVRAAPVRPARQRTYEPPERLRQLATKRLAKGETAGGGNKMLVTPPRRPRQAA